jgi:hypothetical protein
MTRPEHSIYVWDLIAPTGACGVTGKEDRALADLAAALREAPVGAEGTLRGARLPVGLAAGYTYSDPIVTGRHAADGTVVWRDGGRQLAEQRIEWGA